MTTTVKDLEKSQRELTVELSVEEFTPYIQKGAEALSAKVKIEGFRPGKVPLEVLKTKIGEMSILEEAANIAIRKTIDEVIEKQTMDRQAIGQPQVNITKLAPNNPLEYKVIISLLPTIALGKYKDLNLKAEEAKIEDKELDKALTELREMRAQEVIVDRGVGEGDKVTVDIQMFLDKVPLEDGQHQDLAILMGKNYFVPGFDQKLLGAKAEEVRKFELPYPADHHQKNLAGKMVDFEVKVKAVYERKLPELNDALAAFFKLKDLEELKINLKESLLHDRKHQVDLKNEVAMLDKIMDDTKFGDLPEALVDSELKNMMVELEENVGRQGGKFEDYLQHLQKDRNALMLELAPNAVKRVKSALVLRELASVEKIAPTEAQIHAKIDELKKQYAGNKDILKMLEEPGYHGYLHNILTNEQVIARLKDWNYASTGAKQKS
jgi:trigger factor